MKDFYKELDKLIEKQPPRQSLKSLQRRCLGLDDEIELPAYTVTFSVDVEARTINLNDKQHLLPNFFNLDNLLKGEKKTTEYVLTFLGVFKDC